MNTTARAPLLAAILAALALIFVPVGMASADPSTTTSPIPTDSAGNERPRLPGESIDECHQRTNYRVACIYGPLTADEKNATPSDSSPESSSNAIGIVITVIAVGTMVGIPLLIVGAVWARRSGGRKRQLLAHTQIANFDSSQRQAAEQAQYQQQSVQQQSANLQAPPPPPGGNGNHRFR